MSFSKRHRVIYIAIMSVFAMILALPGCKEGTKTSPISSLITDIERGQAVIDVSGSEDAKHVVSGFITSQNTSENLANIDVKLFLNKQLAGTTKTTSNGQFYFAKLPPGLYELEISSPDNSYNKTSYIVRVLDDGKTQPEQPSVKLQAANPERLKVQAKLEGEVVLAQSGQKLANINVELEDNSGNIISAVLTNGVGQFNFDGVGTGTYQLKVGKASIYEIAQQAISVKDDGVVSPRYSIISLSVKPTEKRFPINGRVVSQNTSENLSNIVVSLTFNGQILETSSTTADGQFYFARQVPGLYNLAFSSPTNIYKQVNYALRVLEDGTTQPTSPIVTLELVNPGSAPINAKIEGEVIDNKNSAKLANINIELIKSDGSLHSTALSNDEGFFYFDNLSSAEVYTLKAGKASNFVEDQQNVTIRNDGVVSPRYLIMRLSEKPIQKFTIRGDVTTNDDQKIINAAVNIYDDADLTVNSAQGTRTTGSGEFVFEGLNEARIYFLKVSETSISEASTVFPVRVSSDGKISPETAKIFVQKKDSIATYEATGRVYDVFTGGPLEYATVEIENYSSALTDKNGLFLFRNLTAGNYTVLIKKYGYETTRGAFTINSQGEKKPANLSFPLIHTLKSGYGSIAGRYIDIITSQGESDLFVRLYKWVQRTKSAGQVSYSRYEYVPRVVLTTKTSDEDPQNQNELKGTFKLTNLEPGKYLVYITSSSSEPNPVTEPEGSFAWDVPDTSNSSFKAEVRGLEVLAGQTTYWTNYEQEYK